MRGKVKTDKKNSAPISLLESIKSFHFRIWNKEFRNNRPVVISRNGITYFLFKDGHTEAANEDSIRKYLK